MAQYRVFTLDEDGHINAPPTIVDAVDDLAVVQEAKRALNARAIEVWDSAWQIARLDPKDK